MDDRANPRPRSNSAVRPYPCSLFAQIICIGSQSKLNSKESRRERLSTPRICTWTHYLRRSLLWILTQAIACARTLMFSTKVDTSAVSTDRLRRVSPVLGGPPAYRPGRATRDERRLHLRDSIVDAATRLSQRRDFHQRPTLWNLKSGPSGSAGLWPASGSASTGSPASREPCQVASAGAWPSPGRWSSSLT